MEPRPVKVPARNHARSASSKSLAQFGESLVEKFFSEKELERLYDEALSIAELFGDRNKIEPLKLLVRDFRNQNQIRNAVFHYMTLIETYRLAAVKSFHPQMGDFKKVWPEWAEKLAQTRVDPEVRDWVKNSYFNREPMSS